MRTTRYPNDYTGCEEYMGYTIALRGGYYSAFTPDGELVPDIGGFNRVTVRAQIDAIGGEFPIAGAE